MNIILCYGKHPFTTGEFIEKALRKKHNIFTIGTVSDGAIHDLIVTDQNVEIDKVINKIQFDADYVLFVEGGIPFYPKNIEKILLPTVYVSIDSHFNYNWQKNYITLFDNSLLTFKQFTTILSENIDYTPQYIPHAYDDSLYFYNDEEKIYDISFVGDISSERVERLKSLEALKQFNIQIFTNVWGDGARKVYAQSKIVFNDNAFEVLNPRNFEAAACKCVVLSNPAIGLDVFFTDGKDIVIYNDNEQLVEKVSYLLENPKVMDDIANSAYAIAQQNSWNSRIDTIIQTLKVTIKKVKEPTKTLLNSALVLFKHNSYKEAFHYFRELIDISPNNYLPYLYIAKIFLNLNDMNNATQYLNFAKQLNKDDHEVQFTELLLLLENDFEKGFQGIIKLNEIYPNYDLKILLSILSINTVDNTFARDLLFECKSIDPYRFEADKYLKKYQLDNI